MKPRVRAYSEGNFRFSITNSGSTFYGYGSTIEGAIANAIENKQMLDKWLDTILDDFSEHCLQTTKEKLIGIKRMYAWILALIFRK